MLFPKVRIKCQLNDRNEGCGMREADVGVCVCVCVLLRVRFSSFRLSIFHLVAPFCALRELSRCYLINYRTFVPFPIVKYGENSPIKIFKISTERAALGRMHFLMRLPIRQYAACLLFLSLT